METAANNTTKVSLLPPENSQLKTTLRKSAMAEKFDVSTKTIGRHVECGLLPPPDFHVGRFPHWKITSVENWIETRKKI
jgi:predicted DNA-binding transcriptional regulator AlpA